MKWLGMDTVIPRDEHRWIILYMRDTHHTGSVEKLLNSTGLEVTTLYDAKVAIPEAEGYLAFYGLVEPQIDGITSNMLKEELYSPALLVSRDPISGYMEAALDAQELIFGDHVVRTRFMKDNEKLPANEWYMTSAVWSSKAPSIMEITNKLAQLGYLVFRPDAFPLRADVETQQFYLSPGSSSPTVKEIRVALGAAALYVNSYPAEIDVDWYQNIEGTGEEFGEAISTFGAKTVDVAKSIADVGTQIGKGAEQALSLAQIAVMVAIPLAVVGVGFWTYGKYKEATNE